MRHECAIAADVDARTWNMDGRDGQTWTANAMTLVKAAGQPGPANAARPAGQDDPQDRLTDGGQVKGTGAATRPGWSRFEPSVTTMRHTPTTIPTEEIMLFSVDQAAAVLGIGRSNVYALMRDGKLRSVKVGGRRLIPRTALEAFVDALTSA